MRRIHFADDGVTVTNVTLVAVGGDPEAGTIEVADDVAVGPGMVRDGDDFAWPALPTTPAQVDARAQQVRAAGFAPTHSAFEGRRLQLRNVEDRTNWLGSEVEYRTAVAQGFGDVIGAEFRTAENVTIVLSYADGLAVLLAMLGWAKAIMARSWALKDAIAAGTAVNLDEGWPE